MQTAIAFYRSVERQPDNLQRLDAVLAEGNDQLIQARFGSRLKFGTAGLRGPMGFGLAAMNGATIVLAAQGLCEYALERHGSSDAPWVCVGFDGRHDSRYFAHITAAVFLSRGFRVSLSLTSTTATPLCPFAVQRLGAACGVQVTASHNPKQDNGYKVYASNGAQIVPPMDADIHARILAQKGAWAELDDLLRHELKSLNTAHPLMSKVEDRLWWDLWPAYKQTISRSLRLKGLPETDLKVVYTAMHGVGFPFVSDLLRSLGFPVATQFLAVPSQRDPDPEFSTVVFPNPEEKGALDQAMLYADELGAPLVIANDPDADRFACCEKDPQTGKWTPFSGDELGAIFGAIAFETAREAEVPPEKMAFLCSAVSSRFLSRMCAVEGSHFFETLTGFKYIMNMAFQVRAEQQLMPVFGYEEALGYALSMAVPDKDGVSAAALWVKKAVELYSQGSTMTEYLNDLCLKYGFFATKNSYYRCEDPAIMNEIFESFRTANNGTYPDQIGQFKVTRIRDVANNYDSSTDTNQCSFQVKEPMLTIFFENGAHITFRGSGTEPKFKYYSEMSHNQSKKAAADELAKVVDACQKVMIGDRPLIHA